MSENRGGESRLPEGGSITEGVEREKVVKDGCSWEGKRDEKREEMKKEKREKRKEKREIFFGVKKRRKEEKRGKNLPERG